LYQPAGYSFEGSKSTLLHRHTKTSTLSITTLIGNLARGVKLRTPILNSEESLSFGRHPLLDLSAAAKLTVHPAQITMRRRRQFGKLLPRPWKLNSYCRSHIRPLRIQFARSRGGGLCNYVKQNLTYFARSCSNRVALLILKGINLSAFIKRKNRWLCGHSCTPPPRSYVRTIPQRGNAYRLVTGTRLWSACFYSRGANAAVKTYCRGMG
jgi:hypothetical protein